MPGREQSPNVFRKDPSGPKEANNSNHLRPEPARVFRAEAFPGATDGRAGEPPSDEVNAEIIDRAAKWREPMHISIAGSLRPVPGENLVAVVIYLHLPIALEARGLNSEVHHPRAGKE
jgi:hypothetical protein